MTTRSAEDQIILSQFITKVYTGRLKSKPISKIIIKSY